MKILNVLITLLVISILISGGFLGYLVYVQNNESQVDVSADKITPVPKSSPIPTGSQILQQTGCSNLYTSGKATTSSLADIQFNFTSTAIKPLKVGDKVVVKAVVLATNPSSVWKGIELRIIYPCANLKFVKSIAPSNGEYYAIDVKSDYDNISEVHIVTTKDNFVPKDEIIQLEYEVTKAGQIASLEVADSSTIIDNLNQKFSLPTNKISL